MDIAEKYTLLTTEKIPNVFDAGKRSEYDAFWDEFQNNGNAKAYTNAFSYLAWNDKTYNPKHPFKVLSGNNMFGQNTNITDTKVPIDFTENTGQIYYVFRGCTKLVTIRTLILKDNQPFPNCFNECIALQNITFEGVIKNDIDFQWSTLLSRASIENIVSCLSSESTGMTLTLSQTAVGNAFAEGEWDTLIADKTNWNFSLV